MRTTQPMSITLPNELADARDSEVVRGRPRALLARDCMVETWLREKVVPEYDRVVAGKSEGASSDDLRARFGLKPARR